MSLIQHSSANSCWYSPLPILEAARNVLGGIDFDPASDKVGNLRVQAASYLSERGIETPWPENVTIWLNPPGGRVGKRSLPELFWSKLMHTPIKHAIFMGFTLEILRTTQGKGVPSAGEFSFCVPSSRLRFDSVDGAGDKPAHANAIIYVPGTVNATDRFVEEFSKFGVCI